MFYIMCLFCLSVLVAVIVVLYFLLFAFLLDVVLYVDVLHDF